LRTCAPWATCGPPGRWPSTNSTRKAGSRGTRECLSSRLPLLVSVSLSQGACWTTVLGGGEYPVALKRSGGEASQIPPSPLSQREPRKSPFRKGRLRGISPPG
jgi:hypothetical protein